MSNLSFRWAGKADYEDLGKVMYDAVHEGRSDYTADQKAAWMPEPRKGEAWIDRLDAQSIITVNDHERTVGFMSLCENGYVDFAYVSAEYQGQGLFGRMFARIEQLANRKGIGSLSTHASLMAQPAFSKMGFKIVQKESVEIRGQSFDRYEMVKMDLS